MENAKGGKPQYDSTEMLVKAIGKMEREILRDFAQFQQSELKIAVEQLERSEGMIDEIQKQRQLEKEQYLAIQKSYANQIDVLNIKFANLVKAVKEMRLAQKVYFDKRKKGHAVTTCLAELNHSQKLEKEIDDRLSQFGTNQLFTK